MEAARDGYPQRIRRLSDLLAVMESQPCVIKTSVPLPLLVKAATVLGETFTGRYELRPAQAERCRVSISVEDVVEGYQRLITSKSPEAKAEKMVLCWLSKDRKEQTDAIVLNGIGHDPFPHLEVVIRFFDVQMWTVLASMIVLNADVTSEEEVEQHNGAILDELQRAENAPLLDSWCQARYRDIRAVTRQLVTRGLARRQAP